MALEDNTIAIGEIINDHYKLIRCIALGIDRMIFCAIDTQFKLVAIKFEKDAQYQTSVCIESAILKILANQIHIPQFFLYGQHKNYKFLAEEFLGPNMIDLVNYKKPNKFSLHSILKFGIQAIEALQVVHSKGFVHRDIKPGNFLIGNSQETSGTFYLTDFGTYKKIYERNGVITKPTNKANFRGSLLYASLNAHNSVELGRNDDLMSLLYIMVEFYNGGLPWSDKDDIQKIEASKFIYHGLKLLKRLPKQFIEFELYIISLDYTTVPDYQYLTFLLKQAAEENEIDLNDPFEWELEMDNEREHIMKHQSKVQQKIHTKLQQLENEKHQIKAQNQKDFEEKFFQLNQEISEQKQQILSPNQQSIKLNSLNIIYRLKKKYNQIYNQQQQKNHTSYIRAVKSYHFNNELSDKAPSALVSYSPLHTPFHSNFDMTSLIDQKSQQDSQSNMQQSTQRSKNDHKEGISTVQELLTLLDALVGLDPNTTNDNNNTQDQSSQQQTKNNFIEQFMNEMNKKEEKVNDNNWAQFVNSNTESKENELIETFDLTNQDETTNVIMRFRNDEEQDLQEQQEKQTRQTKNNLEIEIESNLYSPPLLEFQQQNSPLYSPQTLSPTNSSLFHTPIEGSPKTNSNVIYQPSTIPKERQINPQLLEQEVHPINEVIRNEVGQTRAYKTLIANMKITKQPQALIFSSQVELETIPKTPICAELSQELIQWSLTDGSKQDMMRYNRDHSEENSQFSYDKENNNDGDQDSCNDIEFQDSDNQLDKKNKRKSSKFNRSQAKKSLKRSSLSLQYQDQDYDGDEDEDEDEYTQNEDQDSNIEQYNQINIGQTFSAKLIQQDQRTNESNQILERNKDQQTHDLDEVDNIISPFSIHQKEELDKSSSNNSLYNEKNLLLNSDHMNFNMLIEQSIHNTVNITDLQNITIQYQNTSTQQVILLKQYSQTLQEDINSTASSEEYLISNQSSNNLISPLSNYSEKLTPHLNINEKSSPQILTDNAWEIEVGDNKGNNELSKGKEQDREKTKENINEQLLNQKEKLSGNNLGDQTIQNNNSLTKHNTQTPILYNSDDIEMSQQVNNSCCSIL